MASRQYTHTYGATAEVVDTSSEGKPMYAVDGLLTVSDILGLAHMMVLDLSSQEVARLALDGAREWRGEDAPDAE